MGRGPEGQGSTCSPPLPPRGPACHFSPSLGLAGSNQGWGAGVWPQSVFSGGGSMNYDFLSRQAPSYTWRWSQQGTVRLAFLCPHCASDPSAGAISDM